MKNIIASAILSFTLAFSVAAATPPFLAPSNPPPAVQLAWTASATSGISNYFVYQGTNSQQYTSKTPCGTNLSTVVGNMLRGQEVFFNVTAQTSNGLESAFGGEVNYTPLLPPAPPALTPIIILQVQNTPHLVPPDWSTIDTISLAANQSAGFFRTKISSP